MNASVRLAGLAATDRGYALRLSTSRSPAGTVRTAAFTVEVEQ